MVRCCQGAHHASGAVSLGRRPITLTAAAQAPPIRAPGLQYLLPSGHVPGSCGGLSSVDTTPGADGLMPPERQSQVPRWISPRLSWRLLLPRPKRLVCLILGISLTPCRLHHLSSPPHRTLRGSPLVLMIMASYAQHTLISLYFFFFFHF